MFKKLSLKGISLKDFMDIFDVKKETGETDKKASLAFSLKNKNKKVEVERDKKTKKLTKRK